MPQVVIEVAVSGETPRQLVLDKTDIVIGRAMEADVVLEGTQVSRVHCKLTFAAGKWRLMDCNSSNGVYLDRGSRGAPFLARSDIVVSGDSLYIGRYKITVRIPPQDSTPLPRTMAVLDEVMDGERVVKHTQETVMVRRATMKEDMRQWLTDDSQHAAASVKEPPTES